MGVQEIIEAIPSAVSGDEPDGDKLRTELVQGVVGVIPDDASVVTGVMQVDPVDAELGGVRQAYVYGDGTFKYDALDTTTAHDGVYVLNLIGGRRYKRLGVPTIASVLSRSVETPPDPDDVVPENRPQFGDAYLFLTGSWAAEDIAVNSIAVWSSIGGGSWQEVEPTFGPPLYIRDEDAYVRWTGDDGWMDGLGSGSYPASSIPPSALIWDGRVQDQTTNTPPSAAQGVAYIIGSVPTGAWAGNAGKIAIRESAGTNSTYVIYTPKVGQVVFDIALGYRVQWGGTQWVTAGGAVLRRKSVSTAGGSNVSGGGAAGYTYDSVVGPTTTPRSRVDQATIEYAAIATSNKLVFNYSAAAAISIGSAGVGDGTLTIALFRDNETTAIAWFPVSGAEVYIYLAASLGNTNLTNVNQRFEVPVIDTLSHTYQIRIISKFGGSNQVTDISSLGRRNFSVEEVVSQ